MAYLTELHAHTSPVSPCAHHSPKEVADFYINAGYAGLVVTNHYKQDVLEAGGDTWEERCNYYLSAYREMKEYAGDRLNVLLGMELRFPNAHNEYLIFGLTEEFVHDHPNLHESDLKTVHELCAANGLLLVQAHPFRNTMNIVKPEYVDGYEICNGHPGHDSRNEVALHWCKKYGKIPTAGTDFHHKGTGAVCGISTEEPITSIEQLVEILRSRSYDLYCTGPAAERDGITSMKSF